MVSTQGFHEFNNLFGTSAIRVQFPVSELLFPLFLSDNDSSLKCQRCSNLILEEGESREPPQAL